MSDQCLADPKCEAVVVTAEEVGKALMERFYAAMARGDVPTVLGLVDEAIVVTQSTRLPWGGRFEGRDGLARFAAGVRAHLDSAVEVERLVAAGDRVAATGWTRGTVVRSGRAFETPLVHLFTVSTGRVTRLDVIVDAPDMLAALA